MAQWADGAVRPDYDRTREPLEVFALNGKMQRVSGSIPYTSLQWCRRYYESGTFEMAVPANVYDPSWRYIYTDSRYETGMIQKVEFSDSSTVAGGIDTVTVSGFFLEELLNAITFLDENPVTVEQHIWHPAKRAAWRKIGEFPDVYKDPMGDYYYEDQTGQVVSVDDGRVVSSDGLTKVDYFMPGRVGSSWNVPEEMNTFKDSYDYLVRDDQSTLYVDRGSSDPPDQFDIDFITDRNDVFYHDEYGQLCIAFGLSEGDANGAFWTSQSRWNKDSGYWEVKEVTVKGPWQRTGTFDTTTENDPVDTCYKWVRMFCGNSMLYAETELTGTPRAIDPSFQLLGDLVHSVLREEGMSYRLEYNFLTDGFVFSFYKGYDRTQGQGGTIIVPDPILPEGYTQLDYIESTGTQYIDTGIIPNQDTKVECRAYTSNIEDTSDGHGFIPYGAGISYDDNAFELYTSGGTYQVNYANQVGRVGIPAAGQWFDIIHDKGAFSMDNGTSTWSHVFAYAPFNPGRSLYLFALNRGSALRGHARIAYFKLYANGECMRDYYPCRRDSDGAVGMYDLQNGAFYGNAGAGAFVAGPEAEIPSHEEPVQQSPWAVFSDTWGTIYGYTASRDESNYRNTCYVLYDYEVPDEYDDSGKPKVEIAYQAGDTLSDIVGWTASIPHHTEQGWTVVTVGDEDEQTLETYLDLRDTKPAVDNLWVKDAKTKTYENASGNKEQAEADAQAAAAEMVSTEEDGSVPDFAGCYSSFMGSLEKQGVDHLKQNYGTVTNLDTGTVDTVGYMVDWDLGDNVEFGVSTVGLALQGRIIAVDEVYESGKVDIRIEIGDKRLGVMDKARLVK